MDNPWVTCAADLDQPPYVLGADDTVLSRDFPDARKTFNLEVLPVPFVGRVNAPVVLLPLNPSLRTNEAALGAAFRDERRARYGEGDSTGWWLSRKWARAKDAGYAY